jgi:hypothetical protein
MAACLAPYPMKRLLTLTAIVEAATGVALLLAPSMVVELLLDAPLETLAAIALGRLAGAALLTIGVACWIGRDDTHSRAARGLLAAMVLYNVGAVIILGATGISGRPVGIALWPAVVLHTAMAIWCVMTLMAGNNPERVFRPANHVGE